MVDISRLTSGVQLPPELSTDIWSTAQNASVVMRLAQQVRLAGPGKTIPIITGDPAADWVGETASKPLSRATLDKKSMTPYKLAVIEPFSDEFRRDLPALYSELASRLPGTLAKKFDETVLGTTPPGSNFDTIGGVTAIPIGPKAGDPTKNTYAGLIAADQAIANANAAAPGMLNGWAVAPQGRGLLLGQVDTTGRPLLVNNIQTDGSVPALLGQPVYASPAVYKAGTPATIGFAGDWTQAYWGTVQGIQIAASDTASLADGTSSVSVTGGGGGTVSVPKALNLWQQNMFAIRVEIEIGFVVRDPAYFVKLTNAAQT